MSGAFVINENHPFFEMLAVVKASLAEEPWGTYAGHNDGNGADLWIEYGADEEGEYADLGFGLPDDFYAVIDGGTYGTLFGFRIYREDV